jgi:hypothetical protein
VVGRHQGWEGIPYDHGSWRKGEGGVGSLGGSCGISGLGGSTAAGTGVVGGGLWRGCCSCLWVGLATGGNTAGRPAARGFHIALKAGRNLGSSTKEELNFQ